MRLAYQASRGAHGSKRYETAAEAGRDARGSDREDLGRRAPLVGLLPLRTWRKLANRVGRA